MNNPEKKPLVPELRFPEFQGDGEWSEVELKAIASRVSNKNKHEAVKRVLTNSAADGVVDQREYFEKDIASQGNLAGYSIVEEGDYVYNPRISTIAPVGPISKNKVAQGVMSPLYTVFRFEDEKNDFYEQFFKSTHWYKYLRDVSNSGARHDRMSISTADFDKMPLPSPSPEEQKKIADCLSCLDALIRAETDKLDALKAHKKGLLQNLFPAEGEVAPKIRFSEFQYDGDWKEVRLGKLGHLVSGLTYTPDDIRDEGLLVLRSSNVQNSEIVLDDNVYVRADIRGANYTEENDILVCVRNGSKALIGKSAIIPAGMPYSTHGAFMTVFRAERPNFVFQIFQTEKYRKQVEGDLGATINSINGQQFLRYRFLVPSPEEQDKIANCLAAADHLLSLQAKKLSSLILFKKGLIQRLFPIPEEVGA